MNTPNTAEQYSSHIPALQTLVAMGWTFMSAAECLAARGGSGEVILLNVLIEVLRKRRFPYKDREYPLSTNAIEQIVRELSSPALHDGLLAANERLYNTLCLGVTVTEFIDGKKHAPTIPVIDWDNPDPAANSFVVTEELEVMSSGGTHTRRPDVVCYVNGIPLAVIEAKRPDSGNPDKSMLDEGISQNIRNQKNDEIPRLFAYSQLLFSVNGTDGRYATTKTPRKFWTRWREEELDEAHFSEVRNRDIPDAVKNAIFATRPQKTRGYFESLWSARQLPTDQDRLIISLLAPERLLEFLRFFILFDRKTGKVAARYQQAFGIRRLVKRIEGKRPGGGRQGGVIWHTTGSGKSLTMVFLCKALLLEPALKNCRVVVVTDRTDLEKQLAKTFLTGGAFGLEIASQKAGEKARVSSGRDLARRIGTGTERIIFTIIDKFNTASKLPECRNDSEDMIVLVDEGHRSHGGETHQRMIQALPNAACVAFTGTPLLKDHKTTNKFGPIVHAYTMQHAVEDHIVTPLLYEERKPVLELNEKAIDNWFEKITAGLADKQKSDLKQKWGKKGPVYGSANRIDLIAWDIAVHFDENFKKPGQGLKGQLATDSKRSAVRYKKALDETDLVSSAVIISPPDTREGHSDVDESELPEVQQWWKDNIEGDPQDYERETIENFGTDGTPDILIVVDKLLTGFDEPRNAVLYIDKPLREHSIIQAVARVNRLHDAKRYGLLIDYRGILKELDTAIEAYHDLADNTQGGFEIEDLTGLYEQVGTEYKRLPALHDSLWAIFSTVENRKDLEQYRQVLVPHMAEDDHGKSYDTHQKTREDFYEALTEFSVCLKTALSSRSFFEDASFPETLIQTYKNDLQFFSNLRRISGQDAQEAVDYSVYEHQIGKLFDRHVVGEQIFEPEGVILVNELGKNQDPEKWTEEKARNETDIIKSRIKKTIEQDLADDPYAQKKFSELLKDAIVEAEAMFDHPHKQYILFRNIGEKIENRDIETVPDAFDGNPHAQACYGIFRLVLGEDYFSKPEQSENEVFLKRSFEIDEIVKKAVSTHSLNPQNIESEIRKTLLPRLFADIGLDQARDVIEHVIQIMRIGLSRGTYK